MGLTVLVAAGYDGAGVKVKIRRKARRDWLALMPNAHEGYVSWDKAEAIRMMVSSNVPTSRHHGAPKHGDALLAGLLRCRRCGRKLALRYSEAKHHIPRYSCTRGWMDNGEPRCIASRSLALALLRRPLLPRRRRGSNGTMCVRRSGVISKRRAMQPVGPSGNTTLPTRVNRLVTGELEARRNKALAHVAEAEAKIAAHDAATVASTFDPTSFATLAADLKSTAFGPPPRPMHG
jgi:hypothetical protein